MRALTCLAAVAACVSSGCSVEEWEPRPSGCHPLAPGTSGPGDAGGYFPLGAGFAWTHTIRRDDDRVFVTHTLAREPVAMDGTSVHPIESRLLGEDGPIFLTLLSNGPSGLVAHDPSPGSPISAGYPHVLLRWPLVKGDSYVPLACSGIDSGLDLDDDGKNERLTLTITVTVGELETVTLPTGAVEARRVRTETQANYGLSFGGGMVLDKTVEETWYAPGLGPVRRTVEVLWVGSAEEVLVGHELGARRAGLLDMRRVAAGRPRSLAHVQGATLVRYDQAWGVAGASLVPDEREEPSIPLGWIGWDFGRALAASPDHFLALNDAGPGLLAVQRLDAAATPIDAFPGFPVAASGEAAVATDGQGWAIAHGGGVVVVERFAEDGTHLGTTVVPGTQDYIQPRAVAMAWTGSSYLVAWADPTAVRAVRVTPAGDVLDPEWIALGAFSVTALSAAAGDGEVALAGDGAFLARVRADGTLVPGGPPAGSVKASAIASTGDGYLHGWTEKGEIHVRHLPEPGEAEGAPVLLLPVAYSEPVLAARADGDVAMAWTRLVRSPDYPYTAEYVVMLGRLAP